MRHRAIRAACMLGLAGLLGARALIAADERVIQYGKDKLTVRVANVPASEVLEEIGRQSGARVRGELRTPLDVTAEFEAVPLPEALYRILGDQNFALVYGDEGRLKAIRLLAAPQGPATAMVGTATTLPPMEAAPISLAELFERHEPVLVSGRLAEAVGTSGASLQQLFEVGTRNEDAELRGEALQAFLSAVENDAPLRGAVVGQLRTLDDAALTSLLRRAAGEHAEEVATQILTRVRASDLRVRASSVLQKLRAGS
jgi:hypothetical protein